MIFNPRRACAARVTADVTNFLSSLLQAPIPSSLEELDQEIIYVGKMLHGVACNTVPVYKKKKKKFYYDKSLAKKCAHNKEVWNEWWQTTIRHFI